MPSAGPNDPSAAVSDASVGTVSWLAGGVGNVFISDNVRATLTGTNLLVSGAITEYLRVTGFGFAIPPLAMADGVVVTIEKRGAPAAAAPNIVDYRVRLVTPAGIGVADRASGAGWAATVDEIVTYGSPTDPWGGGLTGDYINDPAFGVVIAATNPSATAGESEIDHIQITVHYTEPPPSLRSGSPGLAGPGRETKSPWGVR